MPMPYAMTPAGAAFLFTPKDRRAEVLKTLDIVNNNNNHNTLKCCIINMDYESVVIDRSTDARLCVLS